MDKSVSTDSVNSDNFAWNCARVKCLKVSAGIDRISRLIVTSAVGGRNARGDELLLGSMTVSVMLMTVSIRPCAVNFKIFSHHSSPSISASSLIVAGGVVR